MSKTKAEVMELLGGLPDDCLLADIEHALHVRYAIHRVEATGEDCVLQYRRRLGHHPEMLEGSAKAEVLEVLDLLDDYCSLYDVYHTLYFAKKSGTETGRCRTSGPIPRKRWSSVLLAG